MIKTLKKAYLISCLSVMATTNAFAAGNFGAGKDKYDFTFEYEGLFQDNAIGTRHGKYAQGIEINNDFGITENQTVSFDFFLNKSLTRANDDPAIDFDRVNWNQSFQARYRLNLNYSEKVAFGVQTGLGFYDNGDGEYDMRWTLRGMVRHDEASGFYKHARAEIEYRRWFAEDITDAVRIDLRAKFRLARDVDFLLRQLTFLNFASNGYVNSNYPNGGNNTVNTYDLKKGLKVANYDIYAGPEYNTSYGKFYAYYTMRLEGQNDSVDAGIIKRRVQRNHYKGFLVGYTTTIDL